MSDEHFKLFIKASRQEITPEEFNSWLEAGKESQREFIAKCHDDPDWIQMATSHGAFPTRGKHS